MHEPLIVQGNNRYAELRGAGDSSKDSVELHMFRGSNQPQRNRLSALSRNSIAHAFLQSMDVHAERY